MSDRDRKVIARARAEVLLEIDLTSAWGSTCTLEQIFNQGSDDAKEIIRKAFVKNPNIWIIGEPNVNPIITSEKRSYNGTNKV